MRRNVFIGFTAAAALGSLLGAACTTPQAPLECGFNSLYVGKYTLTGTSTPGGTCTQYEADLFQFEKYLPPGASKADFAMMTQRLGLDTRTDPCDSSLTDVSALQLRKDAADAGRESNIGTFNAFPDSSGICSSPTFLPSQENFPDYTCTLADAGTSITPALAIKQTWSNFRMLNNARFVSTIFEGDVTLTRNDGTACDATYHVFGIYPRKACTKDINCSPTPNTDPDAGPLTSTGSGLLPDYNPRCHLFTDGAGYEQDNIGAGICLPTLPDGGVMTLDQIANLP